MKILFLSIDLYSRGGIQRYSRYQLRALASTLPEALVIACSLAAPGSDRFDDMPIVKIVGGRNDIGGKLKFALRVVALSVRLRPDLIICDHIRLAPVAIAASMFTQSRVMQFVYAIEVWGTLPLLLRAALLRADRVVSDCDFTMRYLVERYPKLEPRMRIIRDCVDCERFQPSHPEPIVRGDVGIGKAFVLLTVSRLAVGRSKGHDRVMEALVQLKDSRRPIQYFIAGDGNDRHRLEAEAIRLGVADSVIFLGAIAEPDLPATYNSCDTFILVSAFQMDGQRQGEGVPLVVLEAQACGKPAITSSRDGSAESIESGKTGFLVDPLDVTGIAAAIKHMFDGDLREQMGTAARQRAVEQFSFEAFANKLRSDVLDLVG